MWQNTQAADNMEAIALAELIAFKKIRAGQQWWSQTTNAKPLKETVVDHVISYMLYDTSVGVTNKESVQAGTLFTIIQI